MKVQPIPDFVLKETTKCPRDFTCLSVDGKNGGKPQCKIADLNGMNVMYLDSSEEVDCPYWLRYGYSALCVCPTHYTLYKQQNKEG